MTNVKIIIDYFEQYIEQRKLISQPCVKWIEHFTEDMLEWTYAFSLSSCLRG